MEDSCRVLVSNLSQGMKQSLNFGTKVIDCVNKFFTEGPTECGGNDIIYQYMKKVSTNNPYSVESCTVVECLLLHKRSTVRISRFSKGGRPSALRTGFISIRMQ